jgi:diadenosine tetraphosphate (Ap4A) HIT family hydrolase
MALSHLLVMKDANFPWLLLVPRRPNLVEIFDLDEHDQMTLIEEIARAGRALKAVTRCDRLNIAALGNVVAQLHIHVIARFRNDAAGPQPVWGTVEPRPYNEVKLKRLLDGLRRELALG